MSPAHVIEPTYASLKQQLMQGAWPIGLRLDATRLADEFGVSVTPVRDCLNRLVGERLVDFQPQHGYRVAQQTERTLRDLLGFNMALLGIALDAPRSVADWSAAWRGADDHAGRTAILFAAIASVADNSVLEDAVSGLNDRLHSARAIELGLLFDAQREVDELTSHFEHGSEKLRPALIAYHCRRREAVVGLIKVLEKGPK